jgi:glycosyltransferase involved in cell wall biosynthesis
MPWPYLRLLGWKERLTYGLRNIANNIQMRFSPRPRKAAHTAAHIWAIGEDNRRMFNEVFNVPAEVMCEAGGKSRPHIASVRSYNPTSGEPLRLVFAGVHIGRKGVPLLLHAIAKVANEFPITFTSLGSGAQRTKWQALAQHLGIADKINWIAELPQAKAHEEMSRAHAFAFPSLQEASSTVTLEALSLGLPVICHDACGMGFIVNDDCGIKVKMTDPQTSIDGFADALRRLHREPQLLTRLSQGALKRSEELSWDYAARHIAEGYDRVLEQVRHS